MTLKVNLIGPGRVGRTLLRLLKASDDVTIGDIVGSRLDRAQDAVADIGAGRAVDVIASMAEADVWLLAVPDSRIADIAAEIAQTCKKKEKTPIAIHCSGYHVAGVMAQLAELGWQLASAHPMLSFADPQTSADRFPGTWVGLEGDAAALEVVDDLFAGIGARTFRMTAEGKALYHAAAVFTNNFTTVLQAIALEAWEAAGVPAEVARELNGTLLASTVENIARFGPAEALTGPAARGDSDVVRDQGQRVNDWRQDAGELYARFSDLAVRLKATGRTGTR